MPTIRISGYEPFLKRLQTDVARLGPELVKAFEPVLESVGSKSRDDAAAALGKPNWLLSASIRKGRLKVYGNRRLFLAVEPKGSKDDKPNTPGNYGFFQENGYYVDLSKVRRSRAKNIMKAQKRGKRTKASYRRASGRFFFRKAAQQNEAAFREEIEKAAEKVAAQFDAQMGTER
ncbi:MAG: hypothetical protein ACOX6D_02585 [Thermoguttaceae bacterium]|jgi:hypothetical protein